MADGVVRLQGRERRPYPPSATGNARPLVAADLRDPFRYRKRNPRIFASVPLTMMASSDCSLVNVVVDLPKELAADVEAVRQRDPDFLERAIQYVLARRIIFEELKTPAARHR